MKSALGAVIEVSRVIGTEESIGNVNMFHICHFTDAPALS